MFTHGTMTRDLPLLRARACLPVLVFLGALLPWSGGVGHLSGQNLRGSAASLDRQNAQAKAHNFTYIRTPEQVRQFVENGYLVPVRSNGDFDLHAVSFPYARPETRLFVERLAAQYRSACGEKLVVTSLTRPASNQPRNASSRSVHPTGMALDLRRSNNSSCRSWLERTLLSLEGQGVLEAIYERNPPHYHVALYPRPYAQHVARLTGTTVASVEAVARRESAGGSSPARTATATATPAPAASAAPASARTTPAQTHRVARGETLWSISRQYGVTEAELREANRLSSSRILAGQQLRVPGADASRGDAVATAETVRHTVRPGESLWVIARRHGVTVEDITRNNGIQGNVIRAGQVLEVPASR
jgi:LysM repeat protein